MNLEQINNLEDCIIKDHKNIRGINILKQGEMVYEKYFDECDANSKIHVYSVTKSIVSLLIGIAINQGYIKSLDQKVLEFFPEYTIKKREKTIQNITLKDMITMTAPYKYSVRVPYIKYFTSSDWVTFSLDLLGGKGTKGEFRYTPLIGPDILTGILVKATGQSVIDFATEKLFKPLGISVDKYITFNSKEEQLAFNKATNISGWVIDKHGVNAAGWGLTLSTRDMAKIGQCCLNEGQNQGEQVIPASWISEMATEQSVWKKMKLSYGYLWWVIDETDKIYAAIGDGGNIIYINKKSDLVVSITALFKRNVNDRIEFIKEFIDI